MTHSQVHYFSAVLGKQMTMNVLLPETGNGPFATFYLLHGLSDDYSIWLRRTRIEVYAGGLPLIVVMPDGHRGFYTDNVDGPAWARHLGQELPAFIERNFCARSDRGGRCVGGLSMGGYGALRMALGFPQTFASANSHSGAVRYGQRTWTKDSPDHLRAFGPSPTGTDHDLLTLAKRAKGTQLPSMLIDCGTEDFLLEENRTFHAELTQAGIAHEYAEFGGSHDWDYWDRHIQDALKFHAKNLGL